VKLISFESFEQILPSELIERLAFEYNVDKCNQIKLPGMLVFACLLDTILLGNDASLQDLADSYLLRTGQTVHRSSIGKRFANIPVDFFRGIFEHLYDVLFNQTNRAEKRALQIRYIDATIVTLSAMLMEVGLLVNHNTKRGALRYIKSVFSLDDNGFPKLLRQCKNKDEHSDNTALGDSIIASLLPNSLNVFDGGLTDRNRLLKIHIAGSYFITRHISQKLNVREVVYESDNDQRADDAPKKGEPTYQLLRVEDCRFGTATDKDKFENFPILAIQGRRWDKREKTWSPLVNITNLPLSEYKAKAGDYSFEEVAGIYRKRWDIETYFKFIKKNLGFSHIISRTQNGIEVMIYMTLIASLLLSWYKKAACINSGWKSVMRFFSNYVVKWTAELMETALSNQSAARKNRPLRI
jgi:hypothetical protein